MPTLDLTNRRSPEELDKLPKPTNEGLRNLFTGVNTVLIKDSGVYQDRALSDKILLTLSQPAQLLALCELLAIDENNTGFYCMCLGTYAIELYAGDLLKATIGFHHGVSIRYHHWNGDAELAKSDELLTFLSEMSLTKPLEDKLLEKQNMEAQKVAEREWLATAPACFGKYWKQINNFDEEYLPLLINDLDLEIPQRDNQIITLLQIFGKSKSPWTAYPAYESVPAEILLTFETTEIIDAYLDSDRNYKTRKGLGRYLCSYEFKKIRKKQLKYITQEVIDDLIKCFEWLGEPGDINQILELQNQKKSL